MAGRPRNRVRTGQAKQSDLSAGLTRKPDLSQHFLRSDSTAKRLVAASAITNSDLVIEAGPGNGALTVHLAAAAARVIAVELDRTLYKRLQTRFADTSNLTLRQADFLSYSLPSGPYTFFSNIPYARTAAIVRKLALGPRPPRNAYFIMEAAAARRFLGQPFGEESAFSLMLKFRFDTSVLSWLDPREFSPPSSVNSVLLRLSRRNHAFTLNSKVRDFDRFAKSVFGSNQRASRSIVHTHLTRAQARTLTNELGFPESVSPSNIAFEHWLTLFNLSKWNSSA